MGLQSGPSPAPGERTPSPISAILAGCCFKSLHHSTLCPLSLGHLHSSPESHHSLGGWVAIPASGTHSQGWPLSQLSSSPCTHTSLHFAASLRLDAQNTLVLAPPLTMLSRTSYQVVLLFFLKHGAQKREPFLGLTELLQREAQCLSPPPLPPCCGSSDAATKPALVPRPS